MDMASWGLFVTIFSSLVTLAGFIIAIKQINKTKKISEAAYSAASEAKSAIKITIAISDLGAIIKSIQEIQNDMINEKIEVAYLHTKTLVHTLIEIRQLINQDGSSANKEYEILTEMITQLGGILQRQLKISINKNDKIDVLTVNQKLSEYEIKLSELFTKIKFPLSGGNK